MPIHTTGGRLLATLAAAIFTFGGLKILIGPQLTDPATWTDYHVVTLLIVAGTIGAGHLSGLAWRSRRVLACLSFLGLFAVGTALVVTQSIARQAEQAGTTMMAAEDVNAKLAAKSFDLASTKDRLANAERQADREMTGQKCGPRCRAWQQNASDLRVVIRQIEADIAALGPQKPVNAGAEHLAEMAGFFGWPREQVITLYTLFTPLLATLFFEIGSIVSLGFAFRPGPVQPLRDTSNVFVPVSEVSGQKSGTILPPDDELAEIRQRFFASDDPAKQPANVVALFPNYPEKPDGSGPKGGRKVRRDRKVEVLADIQARTDAGERFGSQAELAERYGVPTSTLSDWLKAAPICRTVEGRRKRVG